jgi:hypothetical protein
MLSALDELAMALSLAPEGGGAWRSRLDVLYPPEILEDETYDDGLLEQAHQESLRTYRSCHAVQWQRSHPEAIRIIRRRWHERARGKASRA